MEKLRNKFRNNPELFNLLLFIFGAVIVVFITNNFLVTFAPFIIAYILTVLIRPYAEKFHNKTHLPMALSTIICLVLCISVLSVVIGLIVYYILDGCSYLIELITEKNITDSVVLFFSSMDSNIDNLSKFLHINISVDDIVNVFADLAKTIVAALSKASLNFAMNIPNLIISFVICCVASAYMLFDYNRISTTIKRQLSDKTQKLVHVFNTEVLTSLIKMIFSYVIISGICFIEILIGFKILGIEDAAFIALLIAIFDVLPVLGSGGILTPWSIYAFITGNFKLGIGLLVLWGVIIIVRQIAEPKIVGSQVGLHPLVTVAALYSGLKLMGGIGLIVMPVYILLCKKMNEEGLIKLYKSKNKIEDKIQKTNSDRNLNEQMTSEVTETKEDIQNLEEIKDEIPKEIKNDEEEILENIEDEKEKILAQERLVKILDANLKLLQDSEEIEEKIKDEIRIETKKTNKKRSKKKNKKKKKKR